GGRSRSPKYWSVGRTSTSATPSGCAGDSRAAAPWSAGTKPGILTVVLKATAGDLRSRPGARLSIGFAAQGPPASTGSPPLTLPRAPPHRRADSNHQAAAISAPHPPHH